MPKPGAFAIPQAQKEALGEMIYGDRTYWTKQHPDQEPYHFPWWSDRGFSTFFSHGHSWHDRTNFGSKPGFFPNEWRENGFHDWKRPVFGHSVIYLVASTIGDIVSRTTDPGLQDAARNLDLIRPTPAAISRILKDPSGEIPARDRRMVEEVVFENVRAWLNDPLLRQEAKRLDTPWWPDMMDAFYSLPDII